MKKFLGFACVSCIFGTVLAAGQSVSQVNSIDPFKLDRGSSFSASKTTRASSSPDRSSLTPVAGKIVADVREVLELIHRHHASGATIKDEALTKSSLEAMLSELDPHSNYYDAAEFSDLLGEQDSEYSGTGSTISNFVRDGMVETYVVSTHPNSSAAQANLQYGDKIVSVDGVAVSGMASNLVRDRVRGPRGTIVRMTIERAATGRVETIEMKRDRIFQPTLPHYFIVREGVGYIDLSEGFSHTTSSEFAAAVKELHRRGMTSLVLDLRGNTGGILDQAVEIAEKFLPAGSKIISQRGRYAIDNREWRSANRAPEMLPLVLLVDDRTASASEVVAGALQDNDRALILGQTTFGKGLVQNVVGLPMGTGLTLTTARYFTPSGRSIQRSYDGSGMYDYFNGRSATVNADTRSHARTLTNRAVYGGNGITPDEILESETFNSKKAALLDPIFFFVRDFVNPRSVPSVAGSISSRDQIRQSIIFGTQPFSSQELLQKFLDYAKRSDVNIPAVTINEYSDFITRRLNYELALASFGPGAAKRSQIMLDHDVTKAIEALPRAARLAETARQTRLETENKKARRVAFPTGQGRNRRN